jgi:thioesterase domain-containing protein
VDDEGVMSTDLMRTDLMDGPSEVAARGMLTPSQRARLTDRLRRSAVPVPAAPEDVVVDLAPGAAGPPLFLVHGVAGSVHGYLPLAEALGASAHAYGIAAPAPGAGTPDAGTPHASVATAAAAYLAAVGRAQPTGPYRLGGWSTGGLVAFEMARQLEEAGEQAALLVLLDAPYLCPHEPPGSTAEIGAEFAADAARTASLSLHDLPTGSGVGLEEQLDWLCAGLCRRGTAGEGLRGQLRHRFEVFRRQREMIVGHRVAGVVRADTMLAWARRSPNLRHLPGWPTSLAGRMRTVSLDTDHYGLLCAPHTGTIAAFVGGVFATSPPATVTALTLASFS